MPISLPLLMLFAIARAIVAVSRLPGLRFVIDLLRPGRW